LLKLPEKTGYLNTLGRVYYSIVSASNVTDILGLLITVSMNLLVQPQNIQPLLIDLIFYFVLKYDGKKTYSIWKVDWRNTSNNKLHSEKP